VIRLAFGRPTFSSIRSFALWLVFGVAAASLAYVAAGYLFGWRALTVMSGSMEPAIGVGDVVIASQIPAREAGAGQVLTFSDPSGRTKLITHRVKSVSVVRGNARFVTQGDANTGVERWTIPADGTVGLVERRIPKVGYVAVWARSRPGMLALLVPLLVIAALELVSLWRPRKEPVAPESPPTPAEGHP
jgi:signal peptidase I